jgi:uncharacterized protein YndB with AHSA1/START domain
MSDTGRIEKQIVLKAPRSRVWKALTDTKEFSAWFGVDMDGRFTAGKPIRGRITHPGYEGIVMEVLVERIEPETFFSWRWHPYAHDAKVDYSKEPMTLVEFRLDEVPEGTRLSVVESGFDKVPAWRRDEAFRMNSAGWAAQMEHIRKHVGG